MDQDQIGEDHEFAYPPPHPRRPVVLAALGAVLGVACPPLGAGLGVASLVFVQRDGGRYAWGAVAIIISVVTAIVTAVLLPVLR